MSLSRTFSEIRQLNGPNIVLMTCVFVWNQSWTWVYFAYPIQSINLWIQSNLIHGWIQSMYNSVGTPLELCKSVWCQNTRTAKPLHKVTKVRRYV